MFLNKMSKKKHRMYFYKLLNLSLIVLLTKDISALPFNFGVRYPISLPISDGADGFIALKASSIFFKISS